MASPSQDTELIDTGALESEQLQGISKARFENYDKPVTPLPTILEDLILTSPFGQLDVQEIYIELRTRYPYYRVHSEPQVWQNRVRNCLSTSSQFKKVAKPCAKRASFWTVAPRTESSDAGRPSKKRRRLNASSPSHSIQVGSSSSQSPSQDDGDSTVMSVADFLARTAPAAADEPTQPASPAAHDLRSASPPTLDTCASTHSPHNAEPASPATAVSSVAAPTAVDPTEPSSSKAFAHEQVQSPIIPYRPPPLPPYIPPHARTTSEVMALTTQLLGSMNDANRTESLDAMRAAYHRFCSELEPLLFGEPSP